MNDHNSLATAQLDRRFHEGLCLAAGGDFERANTALLECVLADPGCGQYVQEFLANAKRRPATTTADKNTATASDAVQRAAAKADWAQVLDRGLRTLIDHPHDQKTLLALADAAAAQGFAEAEACYVKAAVEAAPGDVAIQRWGGAALLRLGKHSDALACWRRVESLDSTDEEAPEAIAALVIAQCRQRAGMNAGDSVPPPQRSKARTGPATWPVYSLAGLMPAADASGRSLTPIQQLEATVRERPSIPEPYLRLAELYLEKDREYDAEKLLAKGRDATDNDARVCQMWEELALLRHARRVQAAEQELKTADNQQTREALAQVTKERDRGEIEIFRNRIKRQPEHAEHHYELGRRLVRAGKLQEATEQFKKALEKSDEKSHEKSPDDTEFQSPAALELGDCHAQLGDLAQALRCYRQAAEVPAHDEQKKASVQRAVNVAQQLKLTKLAQRYTKMCH